jgi:hypothetical protein
VEIRKGILTMTNLEVLSDERCPMPYWHMHILDLKRHAETLSKENYQWSATCKLVKGLELPIS